MSDAKDRAALSTLVRKHKNVSGKLKVLEGLKKRITNACKDIMERLGAREVLVDDLKALRYPIVKVEWSIPALYKLCHDKGIESDELMELIVNEEAIEALVASGKVTMEEVHACGEVRTTWGFRVDKANDE